jgi:hypothetical protein
MRAHYIIAVVAVIVATLAVRLAFFNAPAAEANSQTVKAASVNVFQIQRDSKNLPAQTVHDMAFVFPDHAE